MKMRKIVAIVAAVLMLLSVMPIAAFAAAGDTHTVTFSSISGSVQYADETHDLGGGISLHITKCHINTQLRIYSSSSNNGIATFTSEQPIASFVMNAGNKADTLNVYTSTDGSTWTLDQGVATATSYKDYTVTLSSPSKYIQLDVNGTQQVRISTMTFTFGEEAASGCDHANLVCDTTCSNCGEYTKEHKFSNTCVAECENGCGTANADYVAGHSYTGTYDATCNICNEIREVAFPEDGSELTIAEIAEICSTMDSGATSSAKYYVTGEITEIYNTTYGNMYITDGTDTLTIYGTYNEDGTVRFDAMADQPQVGQTVKLYGKIGPYNGTAQMQYANIIEVTGGCEHAYDFECSTTCNICGEGVRDIVCVNDGYACQDGLCIYCGGDVAAVDHAFDSDYDPDCNYGCGYVREVEEAPTEATITFDDAAKRTSSSTTEQVWEENGIVVNYAKGSYNNNLAEYANPVRFYAGTIVTIHFSGITSIEIVASGASYATALGNSISGSVVDGTTVTYILPAVADSFAFTLTAQARVQSITVYGSASGDEDCAHEWNAATCTTPATCALCGATDGAAMGHNYVENIIDATCTAAGTKTYECSVCFDSYDETIPVKPHTYVDGICSACGAELPLEATITFGADKAQRTEYSTEIQVWEHDGLKLTNNKAASTTNVGDYSGRFYKDSEIIISFPAMTSLVIDATGVDTDKLWDDTLTSAGLTFAVAEGVYTITFAEPTDSITLTAANQVRANSITASRVVACQHEYTYACDKACNKCYEITNPDAAHTIVTVEAKDATCTENGNIAYWTCSDCGSAWADEALTLVTNRMSVVVPATGHAYDDCLDADCNLCGETREPGHNLTHFEAVEATNCQETSHDEYWYCENCGCYFGDAEATWQHNPGWLFTPGECVRPEGAADCAIVPCEVCGNDVYGYGEHDVLACQGGTCSKCGDTIEGYGCANYDTPACEDGVCYYCGGFVAGFGHENGAWAPCCDGECAYGCGLIYPAAEDHVDEDGNDYCDNCWSHLACMDEDGDNWCDVCWREMPEEPVVEIIYGDVNGDGFVDIMDAAQLQQRVAGWDVALNEAAADVNGDGFIDIMDAALLQQRVAGWDVTLGPAEAPEEEKIFNDGTLAW